MLSSNTTMSRILCTRTTKRCRWLSSSVSVTTTTQVPTAQSRKRPQIIVQKHHHHHHHRPLSLTTLRDYKETHWINTYCHRSFSTTSSSSPSSSLNSTAGKTALVLGSSGALGSMVARHLARDLQMTVLGADVNELPSEWTSDWELDGFIPVVNHDGTHVHKETSKDNTSIHGTTRFQDLTLRLVRGTHYFLQGQADVKRQQQHNEEESRNSLGLDVIVCASGGWKGDPEPPTLPPPDKNHPDATIAAIEKAMEQGAMEYVETIEAMRRMNLDPVLAAAYIAQHYMNANGLFVVMGATAALSPTPGMLGYGLAKTASHHLVQTLGACTERSMVPKATRKAGRQARYNFGIGAAALDSLSVVSILPTTIDTRANRKAMPDANFAQWTKPYDIATEIGKWISTPALRPHSGALVKVHPVVDNDESGGGKASGASFTLVQ